VRFLPRLPLADAAEEYVFDAKQRSAAPDLLNAEVLHALRRFERRGELDAERSAAAIQDPSVLPIARYPTIALLERAWTLRNNYTAYDACTWRLAEALDTPLVTSDEHLASAARTDTGVPVVLIA
jgi:predicted nucleic acid-binding protein